MSAEVGHDINYIALSGALHPLGEADRPPRPPLNLIGDYGGGSMMLITGLLAGLIEAQRTGAGRVVDAAMTDGSALLTSLFHALSGRGLWREERAANLLDGGAPFYRCFTCRDGRFVAVGALEPRFYAALLTGLGLSEAEAPQYETASWPALHARLEAIFATRDRDDWADRFEGTDACVTPVLTLAEAPHHPHNAARRTFTAGRPPQPSPAPRFTGSDASAEPEGSPLSVAEALTRWG
jgi:alpha-methylacyl-CoA racemase